MLDILTICDMIKTILQSELDILAEDYNTKTLLGEYKMDSLDSVNIIMAIEKEFDIHIPDYILTDDKYQFKPKTAEDIINLVYKKLNPNDMIPTTVEHLQVGHTNNFVQRHVCRVCLSDEGYKTIVLDRKDFFMCSNCSAMFKDPDKWFINTAIAPGIMSSTSGTLIT